MFDPNTDHVLTSLVNIINASQGEEDGPGLVLTVGGLTVSGNLIPNWLWFMGMRQQIAGSSGDDSTEPAEASGMELFFKSWEDVATSGRAEEEAALAAAENLAPRYQQAIQDKDSTVFIHLRDARIYQPGQVGLPGNGMYWRGRLNEVTGWSFGKLG
ncbi:hypothetical protein [Streptomyces parvus]|uniref:hypothetical protein n=1 Tax=Streptomyces parvus TaxID=66428 RepID=UPI00210155C5|nr:hypothetical protein [Streptomyces parvus]MCQ1576678.1 hypothetical protein [Streptomyces parvus]